MTYKFTNSQYLDYIKSIYPFGNPLASISLHERMRCGFGRSYVAIAVSLAIRSTNYIELTLFVPTYVSGIKHKPFTFIDYVNLMRPMYDGAVMRTGGMRRGELSVFAAGRKCGKSISTYDCMNSLIKMGE